MYIFILTISSTSISSILHHTVSSGKTGSHHKTAHRVLAHTLPGSQLLHTTTSAVATGGAGSLNLDLSGQCVSGWVGLWEGSHGSLPHWDRGLLRLRRQSFTIILSIRCWVNKTIIYNITELKVHGKERMKYSSKGRLIMDD